MGKLKNLPDGIRLLNSIRVFNRSIPEIDKARASGNPQLERQTIAHYTELWARNVADMFHMDIIVEGTENIPAEDGFVFISNHQGYADIIALLIAAPGRQIGFVAKDSLAKVPYIGQWISRIRGMFISRGDAKAALRTIQEGAKTVKNGFNLIIFPEGTRSRGPQMGAFKPGSFKLATKAKAPIVPVAISGSYHVYEEKGYAQPATIRVSILPPVNTAELSRHEITEAEKSVEQSIRQELVRLTRMDEQEKNDVNDHDK